MDMTMELVHESSLLGAIDSFLKELVHVRPSLMPRYASNLEEMAEEWFEVNGSNELAMLTPHWVHTYIDNSEDRSLTLKVLNEFYRWAIQSKLVAENPVADIQ